MTIQTQHNLIPQPLQQRLAQNVCKQRPATAVKVRNDEWVGARPDVGSTVLLWTRDIVCPKGIATEKRFLYKRGELWTGLWSGGSSSALEGRGSSGVRSG